MNKTETGAGNPMRERFAQLLHEFSVLAVRSDSSFTSLRTQISTLLKQFGEHRDRAVALEQTQAAHDREHIRALLAGYNESVERYRRQQEEVADEFNLFDVMRLTGKEIRHSMVLSWLLDHDIRKLGTHAQGNLGFRLFLSEFGLPIDYAECKYGVRREVAGYESIVDIEVACRHQFLIHIENKIWSGEGADQTDREWSDLQRRSAELNVSAPHIHALFLTPHGMEPANANFRAISWGSIVRILEAFADRAKPLDVKLFTAHYARALRRFIVIQDLREDENAEGTFE